MISIIIPAYNEEKVIGNTVKSYMNFFKKQKKDFEIVIIPNNCKDNTEKIVLDIAKKNKQVKHKVFNYKIGKGGAIIAGFKMAKGDLIAYVDADNSTKPEALMKLLNNIGNYDCVMGSRWIENAIITKKQPAIRRFASRGFNALVRLILNLQFTDTQAGAKLFRGNALRKILSEIKSHGWAFDVGVLYLLNKNKFKIREIPITWEDNPDSRLNMFRAIPRMFFSLIKIRMGK
ncbi:MAG TPA: dolichyl-phosphate beta-glucosyltransferase [Candidatus Nanoarchaeia archaeon]|nr:dolichyl-phosphate beta-glucosyltransferase [Candidatus Nanoarchaeia archaeon]